MENILHKEFARLFAFSSLYIVHLPKRVLQHEKRQHSFHILKDDFCPTSDSDVKVN